MDRTQLFDTLSNLPTTNFERLLMAVNMPRMNRAGASAKIGEQVSALLEWADSPIGPGLETIKNHLSDLSRDFCGFEGYLRSLIATYEKWWEHYTITDAVGKVEQPQPEQPSIFDFGLMVQTVAKEKDGANPLQEKQEKTERLPVLDGIHKYADDHVLLVGRPGSGKSTALIRLVLEVATETLKEGQGQIPILVELRYWQISVIERIQAFLHQHDPALSLDNAALTTLLRQGRFLLLIDGLNELPSDEARNQLTTFRRDYPQVPMIFTTRDLGLGGDLGIEKKLEMQPLTEAQMKSFIRAYVPDQAEAMLRQLSNRLREFGQTPLLLWMLCEVFQQSPNRQMPTNLAEVFRAFTTMYEDSSVRKHEVALLKGDVRPLSDRRLWKEALKALAALMMQGETPVDFRVAIHRTEAERELGKIFANEKFPVRDILDDLLKYHLLQNRTTDQLEFRHQLIQEYYAAEHLLSLLPDLLEDEGRLKRDYLNLLKWTEAITLMLPLVDDEKHALRVVKSAINEVDLMLGATLVGAASTNLQKNFLNWLQKINAPFLLKIRCLKSSRSKLAIKFLKNNLSLDDEEGYIRIAEALASIGGEEAFSILIKNLKKVAQIKRNSWQIWQISEILISYGDDKVLLGVLEECRQDSSRNLWYIVSRLLKEKSRESLISLDKFLSIEEKDYLEKLNLEDSISNTSKESDPQNGSQGISSEFEKVCRKKISFSRKKINEIEAFQLAQEISQDLGKELVVEGFLNLDKKQPKEIIARVNLSKLVSSSPAARLRASITLTSKSFSFALPDLWKLCYQYPKYESIVWSTIYGIQKQCQFYNHEIWQAYLSGQQGVSTHSQSDKMIANTTMIQTVEQLTIMSDKAPIFNQQHATIGVNYAAEGSKQDFTQHIYAPEQNFETLLTSYKHFIDELRQRNPHVTDETAILQAIDIEARRIDTRWQNFLNLQRLWNGGKKAAIKVGEHFVESNPWGKGAIAFLEGLSEDLK